MKVFYSPINFSDPDEVYKSAQIHESAPGAKFVVTNVFYANKKMIDFNLKNGFTARQVEMLKEL